MFREWRKENKTTKARQEPAHDTEKIVSSDSSDGAADIDAVHGVYAIYSGDLVLKVFSGSLILIHDEREFEAFEPKRDGLNLFFSDLSAKLGNHVPCFSLYQRKIRVYTFRHDLECDDNACHGRFLIGPDKAARCTGVLRHNRAAMPAADDLRLAALRTGELGDTREVRDFLFAR